MLGLTLGIQRNDHTMRVFMAQIAVVPIDTGSTEELSGDILTLPKHYSDPIPCIDSLTHIGLERNDP